jgi:hypothetical protein
LTNGESFHKLVHRCRPTAITATTIIMETPCRRTAMA